MFILKPSVRSQTGLSLHCKQPIVTGLEKGSWSAVINVWNRPLIQIILCLYFSDVCINTLRLVKVCRLFHKESCIHVFALGNIFAEMELLFCELQKYNMHKIKCTYTGKILHSYTETFDKWIHFLHVTFEEDSISFYCVNERIKHVKIFPDRFYHCTLHH